MKKIAHRWRKVGRLHPPLFIVRGQTHFCRIISNFLLFNHGQLIVIRTILQNSSQHWGVCDQTMYKFSWIMTFFFFYPHSLPPPNPNWRLYYVVFVVGAIYLVQNVLSLFPILHYLNTWNAKMLSASYRKRQRPPFIAYYYYFFCGGRWGGWNVQKRLLTLKVCIEKKIPVLFWQKYFQYQQTNHSFGSVKIY